MHRILVVLFAAAAACAARSEVLAVRNLRPDESVVLVYRSLGCFHDVERFYEIRGGTVSTFGIVEHKTRTADGKQDLGVDRTLGVGRLSKQELIGLDSYLLFLRHGFAGGCTTRDYINLGYYRHGRLIGEEKFVDATCCLSDFTLKHGRVVPPPDEPGIQPYPAGFPKEVFAEIVPPWLIEKRILEQANQRPEPTARTVTPRAGARVAPAPAVAHP